MTKVIIPQKEREEEGSRVTQKQKKVIEEQKGLVDAAYEQLHEKNKEVMDSITYARRIQRALITPEAYIDKALNRLQKK